MAVPKTLTLPAIPIRDMVLFPGARVPFVVGRSPSVRTLELAIKAGDHLLMLTQKDAKVETPGQDDLFAIGTLALVESVIALPKDYYKVGVKGIARVNLRRYDDSGEVIQAGAAAGQGHRHRGRPGARRGETEAGDPREGGHRAPP